MVQKTFYDCHAHSDFSDGDYPIERLFQEAKSCDLKGLVVSDHNLTSQFEPSHQLAIKYHLETCQGLELSCRYDGIDIHVLGYSLDFNREILDKGLADIQSGYTERVRQIWQRLLELGYTAVNFQKLLEAKASGVLFRYDLVKAMRAEGRYDQKIIQAMISRGGVAYVPYGDWAFTPRQAVRLIQQAGGLAVLAHPGESLSRSDRSKDETLPKINRLVDQLTDDGLAGLEVYHSSHSNQLMVHFRALARQYNLLMTGGSDFHGQHHHPEIAIGRPSLDSRDWQKLKARLGRLARVEG